MPGPANDLQARAMSIEQHSPPEILVHGLVAPEDVEKLFEMYVSFVPVMLPNTHSYFSFFDRINVSSGSWLPQFVFCLAGTHSISQCFITVLDPKLHTPASTFARCPFLFTVSEYIVRFLFLHHFTADAVLSQSVLLPRGITPRSQRYIPSRCTLRNMPLQMLLLTAGNLSSFAKRIS